MAAAAAGDEVLSPRAVLPQDCWGDQPQTGASPLPQPVGHGDTQSEVVLASASPCPSALLPCPGLLQGLWAVVLAGNVMLLA